MSHFKHTSVFNIFTFELKEISDVWLSKLSLGQTREIVAAFFGYKSLASLIEDANKIEKKQQWGRFHSENELNNHLSPETDEYYGHVVFSIGLPASLHEATTNPKIKHQYYDLTLNKIEKCLRKKYESWGENKLNEEVKKVYEFLIYFVGDYSKATMRFVIKHAYIHCKKEGITSLNFQQYSYIRPYVENVSLKKSEKPFPADFCQHDFAEDFIIKLSDKQVKFLLAKYLLPVSELRAKRPSLNSFNMVEDLITFPKIE